MLDFLVVGAGPSGLCIAKTILECEPEANLRLVDANRTIGGVWAKEKLYPGLQTNNLHGSFHFSDFPMGPGFGVKEDQHIPGDVCHEYMNAYAQQHDLVKRIELETEVLQISRLDDEGDDGWEVTVRTLYNGQIGPERQIQTKKLVVATGITNVPHRPHIQGAKTDFTGPIFHTSELGPMGASVTSDPLVKKVAVLGGGKSAYDAVFNAAVSGREVHWIMRKSGKGPAWIFPAYSQMGPFKVLRENMILRRIVSSFSPCIWDDGLGWLRHLWHATSWGMGFAKGFFAKMGAATLEECGFRKEKELNLLEPENAPFWYGTASGVNNYEQDLFDFIRNGQVNLYREDISHLSSSAVHLADGTTLPTDALVTATGFSAKPSIQFLPATSHSDLGIPSTSLNVSQIIQWDTLNQAADARISDRFPRLLAGPFKSPQSETPKAVSAHVDKELSFSPWRLYRGIAPPGLAAQNDRSLVFVGMFSNVANLIRLEVQCLWAYAYLSGGLAFDTTKVLEDAAYMQRYCQFRSPYGHGRVHPDLSFDQLPYCDMLLSDLGVNSWRKNGYLANLFAPYNPEDYEGIRREWREEQRKKGLWRGFEDEDLGVACAEEDGQKGQGR